MRGAQPVARVLDRRTPLGLDAPRRRAASKKTSGAGLPRATSSDETVVSKNRASPASRRDGVDQRAVGRGCERQAERAGEPLDGFDRAVDERELVRIPRLHPPHDLVVDLAPATPTSPMTSCMYRDHSGRAHAHHVRLRALVPAPAALARELLAHLVPHVLGVDEHAVEVEDDRLDRAQARVTLSRPMSRTDATPARPIVRSKSARRLRMTSRTPSSPPAASPHT